MQPGCPVTLGPGSFHHTHPLTTSFTYNLLSAPVQHLPRSITHSTNTHTHTTHENQFSMFHQYLLWQFGFRTRASLHFSLPQFLHCVSICSTYRRRTWWPNRNLKSLKPLCSMSIHTQYMVYSMCYIVYGNVPEKSVDENPNRKQLLCPAIIIFIY